MTAAEKAKELVSKFWILSPDGIAFGSVAKQCAIIAVEEMEELFEKKVNRPLDGVSQTMSTPLGISEVTEPFRLYLKEVKEEIQKL